MTQADPVLTERQAFEILMRAVKEGKAAGFTDREAKSLADGPIPEEIAPYDGEVVDAILCRACDDDHPLLELDNEVGECASCGRRVQFRPHCPPGPKTCLFCAADQVRNA
ncbi:MAG TPA: hypothetical protein VGR45_07345 [Stellaceae bacterium]|nr:hypothetical protein [Stellaceae bacterium]